MLKSFKKSLLIGAFVPCLFFGVEAQEGVNQNEGDIPDISVLFEDAPETEAPAPDVEPGALPLIIVAPANELAIIEKETPKTFSLEGILYPNEIFDHLVKFTIGQDEAMRSLATFLHEHLVTIRLREFLQENPDDPLYQDLSLDKPNILMMGPTGCGKTSSLVVLSKILDIPLAIGNATEWTSQGYIGGKWQDVFDDLYSASRSLLREKGRPSSTSDTQSAAEHGIVFIDEIDKLCVASSGDLEVINRVQQELLPAVQGMKLELKSGGTIDTTNVLFIAGGAFPGLISSDQPKKGEPIKSIAPRDLERYGMLPELAGRLCNIVQFSALSQANLKDIILSSKSSALAQYIRKYKLAYQIDLTLEDGVIDYMAKVASKQRTGARALNSMIFRLMEDKTFNIRRYVGKPLIITKAEAREMLKNFEPKKEDHTSHLMMYS